jgi:monofunctional glycosyltransferase
VSARPPTSPARPSGSYSPARASRLRRLGRGLRLLFEIALIAAAFLMALLWASIPTVDELATRNPTSTAFIELRRAEAAAKKRPFELKWQWRRLDQISQYLRATAVYAEDARFFSHRGVDWSALEKAAQSNYRSGALSIGGSTITQQLAKNLYLSPSRSILRKARELLIAGRLEDALSKERILELYLNVVEWGDGVFGAEAAARHWFHRSARQLTPVQAARLASALPNPFKRSPKVRTSAIQRKVARLLWQLRVEGLINAAQLAQSASEAGLPPPPSGNPVPGQTLPETALPPGSDEDPADEASEPAPAPPAEPAPGEPADAAPSPPSDAGEPAPSEPPAQAPVTTPGASAAEPTPSAPAPAPAPAE